MKEKPKPTVSKEALADLKELVTNMRSQDNGVSGPAVLGTIQSPPELNLPSRVEQHPAFRHKVQGGTQQEKLDRLPGPPPPESSKASLVPPKDDAVQAVIAESKESSKSESLVQGRIREWNERGQASKLDQREARTNKQRH